MRLVSARAAALAPPGAEWVAAALALAERYVRQEARRAVRLHALQELLGFIRRHRYLYGEELIELVAIPVLSSCALDAEVSLRAAAARALTELAKGCTSDACTDLIDLLEKVRAAPRPPRRVAVVLQPARCADPEPAVRDVRVGGAGAGRHGHERRGGGLRRAAGAAAR